MIVYFTDDEKKRIESVANEVLSPNWNIECFYDAEYVFDYSDDYDSTSITLKKTSNGYQLTEIYADKDNEIHRPASCHEQCIYAKMNPDECKECEEKSVIEEEMWSNKVELIYKGKDVVLRIKPVVVEEDCYYDVKHTHKYKGYRFTFESTSFDKVLNAFKELIFMENFLIRIYNEFEYKNLERLQNFPIKTLTINRDDLYAVLAESIDEFSDEVLTFVKLIDEVNDFLKFLRNKYKDKYKKLIISNLIN